jgi:hypothetical protein
VEKRAVVVALALTLPLALYGVPFAYAASTQTTYVVKLNQNVDREYIQIVKCLSPSDYTQHYSVGSNDLNPVTTYAAILNSNGDFAGTGDIPNGWYIHIYNNNGFTITFMLQIICQSPITVAGIGVPEFGSLYVAIALGAVIYFMMASRFAGRPTVSAEGHGMAV